MKMIDELDNFLFLFIGTLAVAALFPDVRGAGRFLPWLLAAAACALLWPWRQLDALTVQDGAAFASALSGTVLAWWMARALGLCSMPRIPRDRLASRSKPGESVRGR